MLNVIKAESNEKMTKLISRLLENHTEIKGNPQRCNSQYAVGCARYESKEDGSAQRKHNPGCRHRNKELQQFFIGHIFVFLFLRRDIQIVARVQ